MRTYARIYTRIYAYTRASVSPFTVCITKKNTRKGIQEMTINDITILAILAAWLMFIKWIMR